MDYNLIEDIKEYLKNIGTPDEFLDYIDKDIFSEILIKKLSDSNILSRDKKKIKSNKNQNGQTHIDITGNEGIRFFMSEEEEKSYIVGNKVEKNIIVKILNNNIEHLKEIDKVTEKSNEKGEVIKFRLNYTIKEYIFYIKETDAIVKFGHASNTQVQVNTPNEENEFNKFRKLSYTNDILVFLKYKDDNNTYLVLIIPNEEIKNLKNRKMLNKRGNKVYKLNKNGNSKYNIKFNGEIINNNLLSMTETPYRVIEHYINNNKTTLKNLKDIFEGCKCGGKGLILELGKEDTVRKGDYFRDVRPNLKSSDGIEFGVYTQWHGNGKHENFSLFIDYVNKLGYEIIKISEEEIFIEGGINKIYSGAPGTGKSKYVNDLYYNDFAKRVTFHPDYTYNDFVGYIRPVMEENNLIYKFVPGIFTEILLEALKDPFNMYTLIIEEMNRANTSSVFGDLFQLLDRNEEGDSEYRINNIDIYKYIKDEMKSDYEYEDGSIGIPSNLNIIATMNTADQNVFVMDTAFKRRWEFEYISVEFDETHEFKDKVISGLEVSWEKFVKEINSFMMAEENDDLFITEDKQIGQYFVKENELNDCKRFAYKVLMYLWEDVFKMDRYRLFNEEIRTFSELISKFSTDDAIDIFNLEFIDKLQK